MKTTPKDFFLHLGATVALYTSAGALIRLSFSVIDYFCPDALAGYFYVGSVAWPVSMLIVLVPILYVLEWVIARDIRNIPEKAEIWIRKWRIYLTLFLGGIAIVGDLIALINTYLNGEIGSRFVYKVAVVFLVSVIIFAYYILERSAVLNKKRLQKLLAWSGIVLVLVAIVTGFMAVGSPAKQRALRFDNQRVSDLVSIQWQIINYWQQKGILPVAIAALNDPISSFTLPQDPETDLSYQYVATGDKSFKICAIFSLPSQDTKGRGGYSVSRSSYDSYPGSSNETWTHSAGNFCFDRVIDPERYPVTPRSLTPLKQ